mgnify:CR=1 FL=1
MNRLLKVAFAAGLCIVSVAGAAYALYIAELQPGYALQVLSRKSGEGRQPPVIQLADHVGQPYRGPGLDKPLYPGQPFLKPPRAPVTL